MFAKMEKIDIASKCAKKISNSKAIIESSD